MSSTTYGFVTIDDHGDMSGNGVLSFSAGTHTGRSQRTKQFDIESDHGGQSSVNVVQNAAGAIMAIDWFEDGNGNKVQLIPHEGGLFYMVGHANVTFLEAMEVDTSYTDLNNTEDGLAWVNGFTIEEANGSAHNGIVFESNIPYGTDSQYTFKIPVLFAKTNERIEIQFDLTDDETTVSYYIIQDHA